MAATDINLTFAKRLEELRKKDKLTIADLADRLYLASRSIDYYLKGERLPSIDIAFQIASYFQVSVDYLFLEDTKMNSYSTSIINELLKLNSVKQILIIHDEPYTNSPSRFGATDAELKELKKHFEGLFGSSVQFRYVRVICEKYSLHRKSLQDKIWPNK